MSWSFHRIGEPSGYSMHITPTADLVEHELNEDCLCGPQTEGIKRTDGTIGWLYTHHALDGRD